MPSTLAALLRPLRRGEAPPAVGRLVAKDGLYRGDGVVGEAFLENRHGRRSAAFG